MNFLQINENDAFLILASPEEKIHTVIDQIILRIELYQKSWHTNRYKISYSVR